MKFSLTGWTRQCFLPGLMVLISSPLLAHAPERLPGFVVPAPSQGVIEIQTPILDELKPGQEVMFCTYLDLEIPSDMFIESYRAFQSRAAAHHAILFSVKKPREPGTYVCGSAEESMQEETTYLAATGGGSNGDEGSSYSLPDNVLFRAVKGQQFMIQTHWLNYLDKPIRGQAVFHIQQRQPTPKDKIADFFFISTNQFKLDPNDTNRQVQARCTMREDLTFFMASGHMHEYGKHVVVTVKKASGESMKILDHSWTPHFTAVPPAYTQELKVGQGDEVIVDCTYKDKLDKPLSYPTEMCGSVGFFYPATKSMVCFDNVMP
ncbi:MAG: hypothetical protein M3Q07_27145 [Pseudobdellovibrionaceae bacterium]|nr:hypothetical protein [Pseudobdellovibrionaceae bacterium]